MKNYAINICLIPSQETYNICCDLNKFDTTDYNLNSRKFIPHATLVMKNIDDEDLQSVIQKIKNLDIQKIIVESKGYNQREVGGNLWTSLNLEKTKQVEQLQGEICNINKNIKVITFSRDNYICDDFFQEEINTRIASWDDDHFLLNKGLHITLGHTDVNTEYQNIELPKEITFDKIAIGHLGNYGSVRGILFEKELQ